MFLHSHCWDWKKKMVTIYYMLYLMFVRYSDIIKLSPQIKMKQMGYLVLVSVNIFLFFLDVRGPTMNFALVVVLQ
jgi:hypothetical protein